MIKLETERNGDARDASTLEFFLAYVTVQKKPKKCWLSNKYVLN